MRKFRRKSDISLSNNWLILFFKQNNHFLILLTAVIFIIAIASNTIKVSVNAINNEKNAVFSDPWKYSIDGGAYKDVVLPTNESSPIANSILLKNYIPTETIKGATVLIRTSQQHVIVRVDGQIIHTCESESKQKHFPTSAYSFVRLPNDAAGKSITVELSSPIKRYSGYMNQIYIGSKASNIFFLFYENGFKFIIGAIIMVLGFVLMLVFIFTRAQGNSIGTISLSAFFQCVGFWIIAESRMAQFFIPYPMLITNVSIFALTLLPVFLGIYYQCTHTKRFKSIEKIVIIVMCIFSMIMGICAIINPMLPLILLPTYIIIIVIYVLMTIVSIIVDSIGSGSFLTTSVCGVAAFGICCLVELVRYLLNTNNYTNSSAVIVGMFLFCTMMALDLSQNFTKVYHDSVKVDALTILAYTDSLTGLKNRTAFLERMSSINLCHDKHVTIAMFDVNNLKVVNDTLGHLMGDVLIRHCVKILRYCMREDEIYRIGGDEFVAIICHEEATDTQVFESRLKSMLEKENSESLSYELSIAYGYSEYIKGQDKNLYETLTRADESMYECKSKQKNVLVNAK